MNAIHIRMYIEKFYRFVGEIILKPQMIITICQHKAMPIIDSEMTSKAMYYQLFDFYVVFYYQSC